ncbi:hypothetical protein XA68_16307 [Ophiocordyceps unilateralis]|uniref:JmjC domain-containing protein n=1 Tax=Ophiocordyceps unilateralis TaxID=268505 RepID=A0A2A9PK92_OPHUN|nr:hypothetical protein XA68_16307 [Ophiocordyceps unilateralis]
MTAAPSSIPSHPLRIKPSGNRLLARGPDARAGIGAWQLLPDETLVLVLECLDAVELVALGSTCKFMYACCRLEELWKAIYLRLPKDRSNLLSWRGTWRGTVRALTKDHEAVVDCGNHPQSQPDPPLRQSYDWPVYSLWTLEYLLRDYADIEFRAEAVEWTLRRYWSYMNDNRDESPLYLFDRKFAEKMKIKVGRDADAAYWRPDCFGPDLLEVLGRQRPAHRWLIAGPERSGSTFHKDPNGTSAWNAVIQGAKYWIMFPPAAHVPGVYVSADSSEVTSPLSIAEWLLTFHGEARQLPGCVEGVCLAGQILHVPSGWWHLVVNLESGIAVTQNFVPLSPSLNLVSEVLSFLRDKPDQVSGFPTAVEDPYGLFVDRLRESYPDILDRALDLASSKGDKKRKWDAAVGRNEEAEPGFSFGFGDDGDDGVGRSRNLIKVLLQRGSGWVVCESRLIMAISTSPCRSRPVGGGRVCEHVRRGREDNDGREHRQLRFAG